MGCQVIVWKWKNQIWQRGGHIGNAMTLVTETNQGTIIPDINIKIQVKGFSVITWKPNADGSTGWNLYFICGGVSKMVSRQNELFCFSYWIWKTYNRNISEKENKTYFSLHPNQCHWTYHVPISHLPSNVLLNQISSENRSTKSVKSFQSSYSYFSLLGNEPMKFVYQSLF